LAPEKFKPYTLSTIRETAYWRKLSEEAREAVAIVSQVLPFRINEYVMRELIDWSNIPDDPIFRLTFPHRDMLLEEEYAALYDLYFVRQDKLALDKRVDSIRRRMNPHPAGQMTSNVPTLHGKLLRGIQHKYKQTVLFFPGAGQTCHAYCTFCFRWPQFVDMETLKFSANESDDLVAYLKQHPEVTDVLITGGDPMVMNARSLARYIEPLLAPDLDHIQNIRIGTKSLAYWPQRFVSDGDADDVLRLFERVVQSGKQLAVMGHYSHSVELVPDVARLAVKRILSTGATLRMQSPVIRHVNNDSKIWEALWMDGAKLGAIPYYMFVERDTGPRHYFEISLANALDIFRTSYLGVSGLARTARGPSMSIHAGKVVIEGVATIGNEQVFVLQFLQARNQDWVRKPFFAKFDSTAVWFDDLVPAFGQKRFFFQNDETPSFQKIDFNENASRKTSLETLS